MVESLRAADPALSKKLGYPYFKELYSLARERSPELFYTGLLILGERLESDGKIEAAWGFYAAVADADNEKISLELRDRAQRQIDALQGRGNFGCRAQVLIRNFSKSASDYKIIVPMVAGTMVGGMAKAALGKSLAGAPAATWLTRGLGARILSSSGAFLTEVGSFAGLSHLFAGGQHPFESQLQSSVITLGALKIAGGVGQILGNRAVKMGGMRSGGVAPKLVQQGGIFLGLMAAHQIETAMGLKGAGQGANGVDILGSMASLAVGSHLGRQILGPRFVGFQHEMSLRKGPPPSSQKFSWAFAVNGVGSGRSTHAPHIILSEGKGSQSELEKAPSAQPGAFPYRKKALPLRLELKISEKASEAEIDAIVKAIVEQDGELYPNGDPAPMSTGPKYFFYPRYRLGSREYYLGSLAGLVRKARGLSSHDYKKLPNLAVVQDWKKRIFGIQEEFHGLSLQFEREIARRPPEREIDEIVKAIVAQDRELFPNGDPAPMSTDRKFLGKQYRIGNQKFTLHVLTGWVRNARGMKANEYSRLGNPDIIREWKEKLFGLRVLPKEWPVLELKSDLKLSDNPAEAEIDAIVKAIVAEDKELYPHGDPSPMSTNGKYSFIPRYRIGERVFPLRTLAAWVRKARGISPADKNILTDKKIIQEWKERLFGKRKEVFPLLIEFQISDFPTESEINSVVRAIVAQDGALYPDGDASRMCMSNICLRKQYRIGEREFSLAALAGMVRRARGIPHDRKDELKLFAILQEWKKTLFGIDEKSGYLVLDLDLRLSPNPTEPEIAQIVQAIVSQDHARYPNGDASTLNANKNVAVRYRLGDRDLSLLTLVGWVRRVRGFRCTDTRSLPGGDIMREWKENIFGIRKEPSGLLLNLDLRLSKKPTLEDIDEIVKAIVAQDSAHYPNGDPSPMTAGTKIFSLARYRLRETEFTLSTLAGWVRRANGLGANDKKLSNTKIIQDWKERIFGNQKEFSSLSLNVDLKLSKNPTEAEIEEILRTIVAQDGNLYPNGDGSRMTTTEEYLRASRYRIGNREFSLGTLVDWTRRARGMTSRDKSLSTSEIVKEWKERIFGIADFLISLNLDFSVSEKPTVAEIDNIVKAIVSQDGEFYPNGDPSSMRSSGKTFETHRYRIGNRELSLKSLAGMLRVALGMKADDLVKLGNFQVVQSWKTRIFNIGDVPLGLLLDADLILSAVPTENQIGEILKAIVAQDSGLYPGGDPSPMSAGNKYFSMARYRLGSTGFNLATLAEWVRQARGLSRTDYGKLGNSQIVKEWKKKFFGIEKEFTGLRLELDLRLSEKPTEAEILRVVGAIVAQDQDRYPNGDPSPMIISDKYFRLPRYRLGEKEFSLQTLAGWVRIARGFGAGDTGKLGGAEIIRQWKESLLKSEKAQKFSDEDIQSLIREIGLEDLSYLSLSSRNLTDYLELLYPAKANSQQIQGLVRAFTGLGLKTEIHNGPPAALMEKGDRLMRALFLRRAKEGKFSGDEWAVILDLYQRLIQRSFTANFDLSLQVLEERKTNSQDTHLSQLYERAFSLLSNLRFRMETELVPLKTDTPFPYQKEGALFAVDHPKAMILDDPGLGKGLQAILAAETLFQRDKVKKVLIVCPTTLKDYWKKEIGKNAPLPRRITVIEGDLETKNELVAQSADAEYVIVNFEFLRNKNPNDLREIFTDLDMLIIDEAQRVSNPSERIQQAEAVRKISAERILLLTATPYYSKPVWIYSLLKYLYPERKEFSDLKTFQEVYAKDPQGLFQLHRELKANSIRREKEQVFSRYGKEETPNGYWKLPYLELIPAAEEGRYVMSQEQIEFLAWISQDPKAWRRWYEKKENIQKTHDIITHFTHLRYLQSASLAAELVGGIGPSPLYEALDSIVEKRVRAGKKLILFAWHRRLIDVLVRRYQEKYPDLFIIQLNGETPANERDALVQRFQDDSFNSPIMVANMDVGGVGLTLTAADTLVFVEKPLSFSTYYQSFNRADRIDLKRKKQKVEIVSIVGAYPEGAAENYRSENLMEFFRNDSIPEILEERLEGMRAVYRLVMDGRISRRDIHSDLKGQLTARLRGVAPEKNLPKKRPERKERRRLKAIEAFGNIYDTLSVEPIAEAQLVRLAHLYSATALNPAFLGRVLEASLLQDSPDFPWISELKWLTTPFLIKNKHARDRTLENLVEFLEEIYPIHTLTSLIESIRGEAGPSLAKALIPAILAFRPDQNAALLPHIQNLFSEFEELRPSHLRNTSLDRLIASLIRFRGATHSSFLEFYKRHLSFFNNASIPLLEKIRFLEKLGLMNISQDPALEDFYQKTFPSFDEMKTSLNQFYLDGFLGRFPLPNDPDMKAGVEKVGEQWGNLNVLVSILGGFLQNPERYNDELQIFREAVSHLFLGSFLPWRNGKLPRLHAREIDYLPHEAAFWDPWIHSDTTFLSEFDSHMPKRIYEKIRIFDTDDPYWILRRGELTDQLKNCFQVNGNPESFRALIADIASKSRRLVVVEEEGRPIAVAMAKVGKSPDGSPVVHLEKPLFEKAGYSFEKEMLAHLEEKKIARMNPRPFLTKDVDRRKDSPRMLIRSIGAATKEEYVEALFGFRPTNRLAHRADIVRTSNTPLPSKFFP